MAGPRVRCNVCGAVIQSTYRHDFVTCNCPESEDGQGTQIFVDGGDDYFRMGIEANADYTHLDNGDDDGQDD